MTEIRDLGDTSQYLKRVETLGQGNRRREGSV